MENLTVKVAKISLFKGETYTENPCQSVLATSQSATLFLRRKFTSYCKADSNTKNEKMFELKYCPACEIIKEKLQPKEADSKTSSSTEKVLVTKITKVVF